MIIGQKEYGSIEFGSGFAPTFAPVTIPPLLLTIDGVAQDVIKGSLNIRWRLTNEPGSAHFEIRNNFNRVEGQRVKIFIDPEQDGSQELIWSGTLIKTEQEMRGFQKVFKCEAADNYYDFDRRKVVRSYENTNAKDLVEDVIDNFTEGFTAADVNGADVAITSLRSNYEEPSRVLSKLANELNWEWYIDENKGVHFTPPGSNNAPFDLTDDNGNYIWSSLKFDKDIIDLKNVVFVRGGQTKQPIAEVDAVDKYVADGEQVSFNLIYRYSNVGVSVNGYTQTVGVDPIDEQRLQDEEVDCLYNFREKFVRFRENNKPMPGDMLRVFGEALIPIIVQASDNESIEEHGVREHIEIRQDIESIPEAEILANAKIEKFREGSRDGSFITDKGGLRPGMKINIQSDIRGLNEDFLITDVNAIDIDEHLQYKVRFLKAGKVKFMDILEKLLSNEKRNIRISDSERIQRLLTGSDSFQMDDEAPEAFVSSSPYVYVEPSYERGDTSNGGIYGFSKYS